MKGKYSIIDGVWKCTLLKQKFLKPHWELSSKDDSTFSSSISSDWAVISSILLIDGRTLLL